MYRAPKVINGGQWKAKCDMYSLGVILFEMCYNIKKRRTIERIVFLLY